MLDVSSKTGARVLSWSGDPAPKADALALRLAGGLHALARSEKSSELSGYYKAPARSCETGFIPCALEAIHREDADLLSWLDHAPQTNEVARSSAIYAGLCVIADRFGQSLELYELGCSGGLNLQCAEFGYTFNGELFGSKNSPLQLLPKWAGSLPPNVPVKVSGRYGCDLNPLYVASSSDCMKLIAYLWPDQPERIARVSAAIKLAQAGPPNLKKSGAGDWVDEVISDDSPQSITRVLYDTIAWNYFPQTEKDRIIHRVEQVGASATPDSPFAWLKFEFDGDQGPFLTLQTWSGDRSQDGVVRVLAKADPHVHTLEWI